MARILLFRLQALYPAEKLRVLIGYDNDSNKAGQKAAEKAVKTLIEASFVILLKRPMLA